MTIDVIEQIALVTGRVLHGGTGRPVNGVVRVTTDREGTVSKVLDDGTFAVSGRVETLFPKLQTTAYMLTLTIEAVSDQFRDNEVAVTLPAITIPAGHDFAAPGGLLVVPPSPSAASAGTILLSADPVEIRGRVMRAGLSVSGASVALLPSSGGAPPPQTTAAGGTYAFGPLVVPPGSKLRCTSGTTVVDRLLLIDYSADVHREDFRLPA